MKFLVVASLIAVAFAAQPRFRLEKKSINFALVEERSANGSPTVTVTFSDGYTDTLVLNRYYSSEEDRMLGAEECHFIGHLAKEQEACVAMTGCVGSEDIDLTIMSSHATESSMFKWKMDGHVEVIESPFKNGQARGDMLEREADNDMEQDLDEIVEEELDAAEYAIEEMCTGSNCANVPATNLLQINAGYDDGFLAKVGGTAAAAEAYIKSSLPHFQVHYCHESLGTKIVIQRLGSIKHYSGRSLQASGAKLEEMFETTKEELGTADLMMYMGFDNDYYGTVGIAYGKSVCSHPSGTKYKQSINEHRKTHAEAGHVIAHEIGHNIGMDHDFSPAHKAAGCDGTGIMSYGDPPNKWSECSKRDLQAHYLTNKNRWCMDLAPTACDGSGNFVGTTAAPPPPTVPPPSSTCDVSKMYGSGLNGSYILTIRIGGNEYVSDVNCQSSVCKPNNSGVTNVCVYMCGRTSCP